MLAARVKNLKPSATIEISTKIREMRKNGIDIISLNIGEPDFTPPRAAEEGVEAALKEKLSQYGPVPGFDELRERICDKLKQDNGLIYRPDEICVSVGTKQAIYNALVAICGPGDEVLLPCPCWVSYEAMITLCGAEAVPVYLKMENGFALDIGEIEKHITARTRAIIINTPNNPTGAVYSEESLKELAELAIKHDFWIISDEIYEKILFNGNRHVSAASVSDGAWEHCITANGFSKAYAIPGWRVGYSAAPRSVAKTISSIQGHITSAASSLAQMGALYAMNGAEADVEKMVSEYAERMELTGNKLGEIPGLTYIRPQGTFYYFIDVASYFGKSDGNAVIRNADDFVKYVLDKAHVAIVPGEAFALAGHVRLSFSNSQENIVKGIDRMAEALGRLR